MDDSTEPYSGKQVAKQYIHGKLIKFDYKLWVMASPLSYCIQFRPYSGKDSQLSEYGDIGLGLSAGIVAHLAQFFPAPNDNHSKYHLEMDNFFTSPELLRHLREKSIAATGTVRTCRMENPPPKSVDKVG